MTQEADPIVFHRARVVRDYAVQYPDPIRVSAGQRVKVAWEDDGYPGWWWCQAPDRREGWIPGEVLGLEGPEAVVLRDYEATELGVREGEEVTVERERHGWLWVKNQQGRSGWIPAHCVAGRDWSSGGGGR
jgi:variant SH3 domain-containing protein